MTDLDFDPWYRCEHPRVAAALTAITGHPDVAAEATDEAFVRAYERWERVSLLDSPAGWVHTTALNVARRRLRRSAHERRLLDRWVARRQHHPAPADAPDGWSPEVWAALRTLPQRELQAVALRYIAGLPVAEVAETMGTAVGTATSALHSARGRMARLLEPPSAAAIAVAEEEQTDA